MINLLPPSLKEQLRYARYNQLAVRYLRLLTVLVLVLAGIFGASIFFLHQQTDLISRDVTDKHRQITSYDATVKQAKDVADRLTAIKTIQASQTKFSLLLDDLAKVLPKGVSIDSITLTGDDKKPVRVNVTGSSYDAMLSFREALAKSARISGVDLENVNQANQGQFQSSVVIGFKAGQAR
jgi:Tfp pilus assembly protein PilN